MLLDLWGLFPFKHGGDDAGGGWIKEKSKKSRKVKRLVADSKTEVISELAQKQISRVLLQKSYNDDEDSILLLLL